MPKIAKNLTHLDINLGDLCNLRCVACECWLKEAPVRLSPELLTRRLDEILGYIRCHCHRFQKIMLIGGEPFMHKGLEDWLRHQEYEIEITLYTNLAVGPMPSDWPKNVRFLISLDAADDETYNRIRRRDRFGQTQENLRNIGPNLIHVDTTVSRYNLHQLDAIRDITRPYGCTHWFLPIDPRMLRYRESRALATPDNDEMQRIDEVVDLLKPALLTGKDLPVMRAFYDHHADDDRINDLAMFNGLYVSGTRHFHDLEDYGVQGQEAEMPAITAATCPGLNSYMEVFFDRAGNFVPTLHCDRLRESEAHRLPACFDSFSGLMAWEGHTRAAVVCERFCGRTQFLGLDEYKDMFAAV